MTTEWPKALRNDLSALIEGSVNDDRQLIERLANDLSPASGAFPDVVARPANAEDVVAIVRYCTDRGLPVYPRGAGISYTNAYVPQRSGGVLLDTLELNRVVTVASDERFVVVEAGVTWQQLLEHLSPLGLRTPFWGPLVGAYSTVGAAVSQNSAWFGSARYGSVADSLLGLEVVTTGGRLLRTGGMARDPDRPFFRYHGPDLTGVFVGDNGAFGVKTRIAMRLIEPAPAHGVVTGRFETMSALADTLDRLVEDRLVTDAFLMDWRHHQRIQGRTVAPELQDVPLALHLGLEGRDERQLGNLRSATRAVIQRGGGEVIESASGRALLERPFQTMASLMVNPDGPIPTPVMGIVPYEHAAQLYERITTWLAPQEEPMRQQSVTWEHLGVGIDRGLLLETIVFRASNEPDVRAAVEALRNGLRGIYEEAGCFHFQLGRFYRTETTLEPEAFQMLRRLKRMLDPTDILNPGVLGL